MNSYQLHKPVGHHVRLSTATVCFAGITVRPLQPTRSTASSRCKCRAAQDSNQPPIVDDADITVLPPPPTGSQYAWRNSWRGSAFSSGGGNGGRGGGPRSHTRDWGRGPRSSLLFVLMYRIRMLLLYGVWITVLYGAAHALTDLAKSLAKLAAGAVGHAGKRAATLRSSNNKAEDSSSRDCSSGVSSHPVFGSTSAAAAASGVASQVSSGSSTNRHSPHAAADDGTADAVSMESPSATASASSSSSKSACPVPSSWLSRVHDRPGAQPFTGLMSVVIPMYLMMMGSILFFASM